MLLFFVCVVRLFFSLFTFCAERANLAVFLIRMVS